MMLLSGFPSNIRKQQTHQKFILKQSLLGAASEPLKVLWQSVSHMSNVLETVKC